VNLVDLWRITLVHALGVVLVFGVWLLAIRELPRSGLSTPEPVAMESMIFMFYLTGLPFRVIGILSEFGVLPFMASGFVDWFANLTSAGLVLLTAMTLRKGGGWWFAWGTMLALDVVGGVLTFSKMSILLSVLPCFFGYFLYRPKQPPLGWILVVLVIVYMASHSFVSFVRGNGMYYNSLSGRIQIAESYFGSKDESGLVDEDQAWWTRLNYANNQAFALYEYDGGTPGDSLKLALIAPIPRVLWPDKPFIESGRDFYRKLTGGDSATFGIGFFVEAYWNGGWLAVVLTSCAIGWFFGKITLVIGAEQGLGNLWILPIALLWIRSGARVDGWIHTEIVGPAAFTLLYVLMMRSLLRAMASPGKRIRLARPGRISGNAGPS
jgi:hypothetical protein